MVVMGLLGLSGCGGGGSSSTSTHTSATSTHTSATSTSAASAERTRLEARLRSGLEAPSSPVARAADLDECIVQQADAEPLAKLRQYAADPLGDPVGKLVGRCLAHGRGLSWARGVIVRAGAAKLPPPIPAAYKQCVLAGINQLGPKPLSEAFTHALSGDETYSQELGQDIGFGCLRKPAVFARFRPLWLKSIRRSLENDHLPPAFVDCVLHKAAKISPPELSKLIRAGSAAENAYGEKLGRACRAAIGG